MRKNFLPYALPSIGAEEIEEVVDSLRSGWITTGPKVAKFEEQFAKYVGSRHAIAVNSCTAALHVILTALGIRPGDEVIVPTLTFCSTAHVVAHLGAKPVLVDVDKNGQISLDAVERAITWKTRGVIPVHYAGQPCDIGPLLQLAETHGIDVIEDAAHAVGADYAGRKIGTHGRAIAFSFYATKNLATGEGGMITTCDSELAARMRPLVLHGMNHDAWNRYSSSGSWYYEVAELGYKYNMMDIQAALGIHQLRKLDALNARRIQIAAKYTEAFAAMDEIHTPEELPDRTHVFHLYPIQVHGLSIDRAVFINELRNANIGTSVHFIPLHRHPFYRERYGYRIADFPVAEHLYTGLVSLPLYPSMTDGDVQDVIDTVRQIVTKYRGMPRVAQLRALSAGGER
ncbi:MAG TPA: DegT/DnrJ/EryC1/StrS aminotransferase family protein [Bryobacteraceae bacterium]|nr:DegT/DnrJ/EryC1/StrS aminotransferase family protein [Bryobacteraceae bacterium]